MIRILLLSILGIGWLGSGQSFGFVLKHTEHVSTSKRFHAKNGAEGYAIELIQTLLKRLDETRRGETNSKIVPRQDAHVSAQVVQLQETNPCLIAAAVFSIHFDKDDELSNTAHHPIRKNLFRVVISPNAP